MTYTYIINVVAPININSDKSVSYNKYPIVCISKKNINQVFENDQVRSSIIQTLKLVGTDLYDKTSIHVRIVDSKAKINDVEEPLNKIMGQWK